MPPNGCWKAAGVCLMGNTVKTGQKVESSGQVSQGKGWQYFY